MIDPLLAASAPPAHLPGVLHSLEPTLNRFGYLSLGLVFLEDFGVPVPGETVLIIAAVYAGTGRLNIWLVALIAFLAAILGDNVGFGIGHFGGRPLAERYGKYILLTPERLDKTASFFDRHGGKVIVIARFVEGLRQANGIIAGITGMHWKRFVPFNMLGAALWVGVWVSIGYFSGSNIDSIYRAATRYEAFFAIAVGLLVVGWVGWRVWKHQREHRAKVAAGDNGAGEHAATTPGPDREGATERDATTPAPGDATTPGPDRDGATERDATTPAPDAATPGPDREGTTERDATTSAPDDATTPASDHTAIARAPDQDTTAG
ncbi:MAG TPA: VTT domain-containing protein [Solirubrobacteraceae bacterium]|nr:VTT domain-containing protein [Solirubrobacteraceae bacterium]